MKFCEDCGGIQTDLISAAIPPNKPLPESPSGSTAPVTRNSRSTLVNPFSADTNQGAADDWTHACKHCQTPERNKLGVTFAVKLSVLAQRAERTGFSQPKCVSPARRNPLPDPAPLTLVGANQLRDRVCLP